MLTLLDEGILESEGGQKNSHSAPLFQALSDSQLPEILKFTEAYLCSSPLEARSQTLSANPSHYLHNTEN